ESRTDAEHRRLDVVGALTVTGGLVAIVYGIVRTETYGWTSPRTLVPIAAGLALLGGFVAIQANERRTPLMPLRIFRSRALAGANGFLMLLFGAMFGTWYFETLFMQHVLGYTPLAAGLAFLPQTILIAVASQVAARLVTRFGPRRLLLAGAAFAAVGVALLTRISPASTFAADLLVPFLLIGIGMGISVTPATVAATGGVPPEDAGLASGLLNTSRFVGASIGLAVLSTVAASRTAAVLSGAIATPARQAAALTAGYTRALWVAAALLVVAGIVVAVALPRPARAVDDEAELIPMFDEDVSRPELESA
ncbi:MAG TPA: MFS transporter, partial [Actinomycetota bacterium]|nr:MFS transporter [Actinomycetota bacterium]